jgi:hypothetical protein
MLRSYHFSSVLDASGDVRAVYLGEPRVRLDGEIPGMLPNADIHEDEA